MDVYPSLTYSDEIRFAATKHGGGMIMIQPELPDDLYREHAGRGWVYVVVDDPDEHCARARGAGANLLGELHDAMGGHQRGYSVRDLEGNLCSLGTSRPEAAPLQEFGGAPQ
jgi:uncharacterized glyoxalase superfamily protein PhnB